MAAIIIAKWQLLTSTDHKVCHVSMRLRLYTVTLSAENEQKRKLFFADVPFVYMTTTKTSGVFKRSIIKTKTVLKVETFKNDKTETTIFIV